MRGLKKIAAIFSMSALLAAEMRAQRSLERTDFSADLHGILPHQVISVSDTATISVYNGARGVRQELADGTLYYVNYRQQFFSKGGFRTEESSGKRVWWQSTRNMSDITESADLAKIKELRAFLPPRIVACPEF